MTRFKHLNMAQKIMVSSLEQDIVSHSRSLFPLPQTEKPHKLQKKKRYNLNDQRSVKAMRTGSTQIPEKENYC